jgi:hypothetical protein
VVVLHWEQQAKATMITETSAPSTAYSPSPMREQHQREQKHYHGDGRDIILQGFHWHSHGGACENHKQGKLNWYRVIKENAAAVFGGAGLFARAMNIYERKKAC